MPTSPANDEQREDAPAPVSAADGATEESAAEASQESDEIVALHEDLARVNDRYRRALADLDNYRKRVEREGDRRATEVRVAMLREWLEAVDSVERALRMQPGEPGLTAVLEQMETILARQGVVRLDAVGAKFDPERHEAIAVQVTANAPDHTVVEVARSGFALDDGSILRPAQVVVARPPTGET